MFAHSSLASLLLLPALLRTAIASTACNNSPNLCSKKYNEITYLGAHDSPFLRDEATGYTSSGNQYYNTSVQLSAGVRLVSGQVQTNSSSSSTLNVCHTSCDLLYAGTLTSWLSEIKTWMDNNPNEVVTVILVNGADASASEIAQSYEAAGITSSLAYAPSGSSSGTQTWPTLREMIRDGKRLVNLVQSITPDASYPWLINQDTYVFENNYNNNAPSDFSCTAWSPSNVANDTSQAISDRMLPLMNHFLYSDFFGIQTPNATYADVTNSPSSGEGTLGMAADQCTSEYGQVPTYILVDFFNVGPAIATADSLNDVSNPVGRTNVSTATPTEDYSSGAAGLPAANAFAVGMFAVVALWALV